MLKKLIADGLLVLVAIVIFVYGCCKYMKQVDAETERIIEISSSAP